MQLRRAALPENFNRQRLATPGSTEAVRGIFLGLSFAQNYVAEYPMLITAQPYSDLSYEKVSVQFIDRSGRSGRNGRLRPDKETGGAREGGANGFAFRSSRAG